MGEEGHPSHSTQNFCLPMHVHSQRTACETEDNGHFFFFPLPPSSDALASADLNVAFVFRSQARTKRKRSLEHDNAGNEAGRRCRPALCTSRALCFTFRAPRDFLQTAAPEGPRGRWWLGGWGGARGAENRMQIHQPLTSMFGEIPCCRARCPDSST